MNYPFHSSLHESKFLNVICRLYLSTLSKNYFRNNARGSNSLYPDQARRFVRPDLGPNCLQRLLADDTVRQRVQA